MTFLKTSSAARTSRDLDSLAMRVAIAATVATLFVMSAHKAHAQAASQPFAVQSALAQASAPAMFADVARDSSPFSSSETSAGQPANPADTTTLPEDPATLAAFQSKPLEASVPPSSPGKQPMASRYSTTIPAGESAYTLTAHDKVIVGLNDSFSVFSLLGIIASAGYSHIENGQPNYGTDRGAFGQRLGATALRDTSETLFTDAVFAPVLRQDPRYYVLGSGHNFFTRVFYSATRPLITRTDGGRQTINASQILGNAAGSAISYAYYPKINQNFNDTAATFAGSFAGDAIGDFVTEFSSDFLVALHLKKAR